MTRFLREDELDVDAIRRDPLAKFALEVDSGSFTWDGDNEKATLKK